MAVRLISAILMVVMVLGWVGTATAADAAEVIASVTAALDANDAASDKVKEFTKNTLIPMCTNQTLVSECKRQNQKQVSLDEIKKIDQEWKDAEDLLPIQKEKTNNLCAQVIKQFAGANAAVVEAFVMDNQGANVGQNELTSDYWQGDEAKWKNSFNEGKGGVEVGEVELDKSANAQLQQISLPIVDQDGAVVGAVTYGINVDKL